MRMMMIAAALAAAGVQVPDDDSRPALTPGTVEVQVVDEQHQTPKRDVLFAAAVGDALTNANFLILPGEGHSRYIARVTASEEARGTVATPAKSSGDINAVGGRIGVSLPGAKTQLSGLVVTRLDVQLVLRDSGQVVWSGSASTAQVRGTAAGAPQAVVKKLADALIRRFPQPMEGPISVP